MVVNINEIYPPCDGLTIFDNGINILFPKWKLEIAFLSLGISFFDD